MTLLVLLGRGVFFFFLPTHPRIHCMINKPILGKVLKSEIMGFYFSARALSVTPLMVLVFRKFD